MAGKISELAPITGAALALTDFIEALDVSDLSMAPTGTNKQLSLAETINFLYANGFDGRYVNVAGDTMTSGLTIAALGGYPLVLTPHESQPEALRLNVNAINNFASIAFYSGSTKSAEIYAVTGGNLQLLVGGTNGIGIDTTDIYLEKRVTLSAGDPTQPQHATRKSYVDAQVATRLTPAAADTAYVNVGGDTMTGALVLPADPTASLEAATKQYVDNLVRGLAWKDACRVATTVNITTSGLQTIDGVTVVNGDRVLVKNQSAAATNGILIVSTGAWARSFDADSSSEIEGMACFVAEGTTQADTAWVCTANAPITTGSTALPFVQFAGTGGSVSPNRLINTTAPISGGGDLSVDRTLSLAAAGVTNAYLATMPTHTFKGNNTAGTAAPLDLTISQMQTELAVPALPVTVANGGSGRNTATTAYGLIAAGTTPTGVEQTVAPAASGFLKTTSTTALPAWAAIAQGDVTNLVNDLSNKQPLDSDLSAIAALAHVANSMIQSNGSAWIAATPTQVKTGLAITKTDVGLGNVDNTSDANKLISTATQTALDAKQPLDTDLTTIAGLAQASGSILQSNGTAWTAATPAQAKTALALDQVNNTSDANKPVSTAQNNALALRVLKAGDTMTGRLIVGMQSGVADAIAITAFSPGSQAILGLYDAGGPSFATENGSIRGSPGNVGINTAGGTAPYGIYLNPNGTTALSVQSNGIWASQPLTLQADPTIALHAATKQYVDGLAAQATLDARYINVAGDTMTGALVMDAGITLNPGMHLTVGGTIVAKQINVDATTWVYAPNPPTVDGHLTNKLYVDTQRDTRQPLDADLTTLAGLTATTNNIIQSVGSAWASRTPAQVTATLDQFTATLKGLVPPPATATGKFLKDDGTWATAGGGSAASETVAGIAEIATTAEVATGTDDTRIVSPLKLRQAVSPTWTGTQAAFDLLASLDSATHYYVTP